MYVRIPIYVEERKPEAAELQHVRPVSLRPLFFPQPSEQDVSLQRATARLTNELRRELSRLARLARHEELAAYSFYPPLEETLLEFTIEVAKKRYLLRHLFVVLSAFGRRWAWTPSVPEGWGAISRGATVRDRVQEALTEHYRSLERRYGSEVVVPHAHSVHGKAWITSVEVSIDVPLVYQPTVQNFLRSEEHTSELQS